MVAILKFKMAAPNEEANVNVIDLIEFLDPENIGLGTNIMSMNVIDRDMVKSNIYGGHFEKTPSVAKSIQIWACHPNFFERSWYVQQ